jgi:hypothetical protein
MVLGKITEADQHISFMQNFVMSSLGPDRSIKFKDQVHDLQEKK